jgi:hypothetical protein
MIQLTPRPHSGIRSGQRRTWLAAIQTPNHKGSTMSTTQKRIVLATVETLVTFLPTDDTVVVTTKTGGGKYHGYDGPWHRVTMGLEQARAEYRRLLASGYYPW